jgi:hypothetical protein
VGWWCRVGFGRAKAGPCCLHSICLHDAIRLDHFHLVIIQYLLQPLLTQVRRKPIHHFRIYGANLDIRGFRGRCSSHNIC